MFIRALKAGAASAAIGFFTGAIDAAATADPLGILQAGLLTAASGFVSGFFTILFAGWLP